jgi:hypothetical protein
MMIANDMTTQANIILVAKDYSPEPAGRFPSDGPNNGERFRKKFLVPRLKKREIPLIVDFDETEGYGSSFLEEAFGGLVRVEGFTASSLRNILRIESKEDPSVIEEIWLYIEQAKPMREE